MIQIGLIGAGGIGGLHARVLAGLPNARLVAVADIDPPAADRMAARTGAKAYYHMDPLLADPAVQAVYVCVPTYVHAEVTIAAANAGKPLFCEKPVSLTLANVDRMIAAVDAAGVPAMIAQVVRFWPEHNVIRQRIESGALGRPLTVSAARLGTLPSDRSWFADPALSGGALLDLHIHDLDFIYSWFGLPRTVYAMGHRSATGSWDQVLSCLDYGHVKVDVEASFMEPAGYPFSTRFRVLAEHGCVEFRSHPAHQPTQEGDLQGGVVEFQPRQAPVALKVPADDPYRLESIYFLDCLERGVKPAIATLAQAREVLALALASQRSLVTGQLVDMATAL